MKHLFVSAIFVGGVLPMICFGVFNYFYKPISANISTGSLLVGVALGGMLVALGYDFFFGGKSLVEEVQTSHFIVAIGAGLLWGLAVLLVGIAFSKLNANASQIIPIINANSLITVILALIFLKEQVVVWKVITGAILIVLGTFFLV